MKWNISWENQRTLHTMSEQKLKPWIPSLYFVRWTLNHITAKHKFFPYIIYFRIHLLIYLELKNVLYIFFAVQKIEHLPLKTTQIHTHKHKHTHPTTTPT